ncbi:TIGR03773 family transporter-associated surface protein [Glycomyces buryatensis]|uniref:Cell wall anchor protein n=1 Tax=Glycomyces buryatensis TaxID=2570927 RepID=A0A4S8QIF6_9ACTN|nr:TIGR03773 family transporter-associated surface protein [Glycomyces buryatensis]THV42775.1 hypothetical protein FAB82_04445 [Glycomyces buryatensis]
MNTPVRPLTAALPAVVTAALVAAVALAVASPASAQSAEPEGIAEFEATGSGLAIDAPTELSTVPSLVPEREDFAFLGDPGDLVWVAGTEDGATYPTLDATDVEADLTVSLDKVEGPGEAWLYTFAGPGVAEPLASTADDQVFTLAAGTTAVVVLAVDQPGQYTVELTAKEKSGHGYAPLATFGGHAQSGSGSASATYAVSAAEATASEVQNTLADSGDAEGNGQAEASCVEIGSGHVDIGPRLVDGEWTAQIRDDTGSEPTWRELSDVVLTIPDSALFPIPEGDAYGFLGEAGQDIYMLPQTQSSDIVWPGWNTQDSTVIEAIPGAVDWNLTDVSGPGDFTLFLTSTFGGAEVLFDSGEALPQTVSIPRNTHAHGNWTFSEAGVYQLTIEFTAKTAAGEEYTDDAVVQLAVGDSADAGEACTGGGSGDTSDKSGGDDGDGDSGGFLPTTGTGWILWGLGAAALAVIIGVIIMVATRKRKAALVTGDADAS